MILKSLFLICLMLIRNATAQTDSGILTGIDSNLAQLIPDIKGTHRSKIIYLVSLRERECAKTPTTCLSFAKLSKSLCKSGASDGDSSTVIWRSIFRQITKRENALQILNQIKACSSKPTSGQLLGTLELLTQLNTLGWLDLAKDELKWLGIRWKAPAVLTDEDLGLISLRLKTLSEGRPLPMDIARDLSLISAQWAGGGTRLKGIEATNLKSWLNSLRTFLINTGQSQAFAQAVLSLPYQNLGKNDLKWSLGITKALCVYWKQTVTQRIQCQSALIALKKKAIGQPPLLREIEVQELRMELESATSAESKKKAEALLLSAENNDLKDLLPWMHFDLSKLNLQLHQINEAKSHLEMHLQLTRPLPPPLPFSISGKILNIDILSESGQYEVARKEAENVRADLMKTVRGTTNSLVWLDLNRLALAAVGKRTNDANRIADELKHEIADLPDLKILNVFITSILRGMTGANALSDIEPAKKVFGPRSYEIMRMESLLRRIAKSGS